MSSLLPFGHTVEVAGIGMVALPPARIELDISSTRSLIHVVPDRGKRLDVARLDGAPYRFEDPMRDSVSTLADGFHLEARGTMGEWGLVVEFDRQRVAPIMAEALDGAEFDSPRAAEYQDRASSMIARLAIEHLRSPCVEPLYLDGLATSIIAYQAGRTSRRIHDVATTGTGRRIERVIDYIEAHLDGRLNLAELASVATMSPIWFSASFRARTGRSVHAWVVHRRLERARELLRVDSRPIVEVALSCGFSSQTHLTIRFGQAYGVTPARWRNGA